MTRLDLAECRVGSVHRKIEIASLVKGFSSAFVDSRPGSFNASVERRRETSSTFGDQVMAVV